VIARLVQRHDERIARDIFDLVRPALRANKAGSTSQDITNCVLMKFARGCIDQITYATSVALRLMVESGEVNHFTNEQGEKVFRLKTSRTGSKRRRKAPSTPKRSKSHSGYRGLSPRRSRRVKNH